MAESIYDLIAAVRAHPDYRFGVIFTADDTDRILSDSDVKVLEQSTTAAGFDYLESLASPWGRT